MQVPSYLRPIIWKPKQANGLSFLLPGAPNHTAYLALVSYLHRLNQNEELSTLSPDWMPRPDECFEWETWFASNIDDHNFTLIVANDPKQYAMRMEGIRGTIKKLKCQQRGHLVLMIAACHSFSHEQRQGFYEFISYKFNCLIHLGGQGDVHPSFYKEKIGLATGCIALRDYYEIELTKTYYYKSKGTILGFCRGMQLCNVAFGGKLFQDIKANMSGARPHQDSSHQIRSANTRHNIFSKLIDHSKNILVNSYHHQAVKSFNNDIFEVAATEADGTIEALEFKNGRGILFQFHPEIDESEAWYRLFAGDLFETETMDHLPMIMHLI
jgi:putative glutamine amidotransferase